MQNQETKRKINIGNVNQMFKQELLKDKYLKTIIYIGGGVIGLFALGFIFKAINYTAFNFKALNRTLKS